MNILFYFENVINPTLGGTERATENLARAFYDRGHRVYFLSKRESTYHTLYPSKVLPNKDNLICAKNISFIEDFVKRNCIDIVFNQGGNTSDILLFNHKVLDVKCKIITCLHFAPYQGFGKYWYKDIIVKDFISLLRTIKLPITRKRALQHFANNYLTTLRYTDSMVVLSESFIDDICSIIGTNYYKYKINAIPNINSFPYSTVNIEKGNRVLYVGRHIYSPKRIDRLLKAWEIVEKAIPNVFLDILGDGPDRVFFERYAKKLRLKNVAFHGFVNPIPFYKRAKIIALTSTHESFGMTLVEGTNYGCIPVAYSSYSSLNDIITDGYNGFAVEPFNEKDFAERIIQILSDDSLRLAMSRNGKKTIKRFEPGPVIEQWEHLIEGLNP